MSIFNFDDETSLGSVISVDTANVTIRVEDLEKLKRIQVNRLMALRSSKPGEHLVGIVSRITRKGEPAATAEETEDEDFTPLSDNNLVRVSLIGTLLDRKGIKKNIFRRTLETVPEIDANCFALEGEHLTSFMQVISTTNSVGPRLSLGKFTLDEAAEAFVNGNKLFQRHALVVGSTGSGKSFTIARLLEQVAKLDQANVIVFDIHGEYNPLEGDPYRHLKIAGPGEIGSSKDIKDGVLYLPFWLLGYEALVALFVDRSDANAPNQTMQMANVITDAKRQYLTEKSETEILNNFTIDSPIPFAIERVLDELNSLNSEMVKGAKSDKQGPFFNKLSRLIARLESKQSDKRLGFLFQPPKSCMELPWLEELVKTLIGGRLSQDDKKGGVKIIDFSEVPSDLLPLMVSLIANIVFTVHQWTLRNERHPIALVCDEAHLYIPERTSAESADAISVRSFERIAKEGRKYGVGLVVVSQRPSEVNRTVLSQCNNVIAMRLTNGDDQTVIRRLLPDSLGGFGDLLPVLDIGEALIVGDASLLPTRVRIDEPSQRPDSQTVEFWDKWSAQDAPSKATAAVRAWRKQSMG